MSLGGAEVGAGLKVVDFLSQKLGRTDHVAVLKARAATKSEIRENLYAPDANWGDPPEVIILKLGDHDGYPDYDVAVFERGASKWFKAEVKGLDDRGLEVYSAVEYVVIKRGKARRVRREDERDAKKVIVTGVIPYERIRHVDWEPDPGYFAPRFYVEYTRYRNEAIQEFRLYGHAPHGRDLWPVNAKYVSAGGGPFRRTTRFISNLRWRLKLRRSHELG